MGRQSERPRRADRVRGAIVAVSATSRSYGYGLLSQACSSATNFGLVLLAGRLLGPSGLGTLLIGFGAYVLLLGFQRALLSEPLIATSSAEAASKRAVSARAALTISLIGSVIAAFVLAAIGVSIPNGIGHGMLLFAPWLPPALVQDLGRAIVFRDRKGASVAFSDMAWLVAMAVLAPVALATRSDWVVVACWGVGALFGTSVVLAQLHWRPTDAKRTLAWWRNDAWGLGRWLGVQSLLYNSASYTTVLLLAGILGASDYGGFRAVQSVFAPLSLLGPALALPGLPLVSSLISKTRRRALKTAGEIAALVTALTGVYVGILYAFPHVLVFFFGQRFTGFRSIIVPIGLGQLLLAPTYGLTLFLKADRRGHTLLWFGTLNAAINLLFTVVLGSEFGLAGAAWGAAAAGVVCAAGLLFAFRPSTLGI